MPASLFSLSDSSLPPLAVALPRNHERLSISEGKAGTAQTIERMRDLVMTGKRSFPIREKIGQIIADCEKKDYYCYCQKIFEFCRDRIIYGFDPVGVELIENPEKILDAGIADCDSICILLASMYEAIGFPCRFVTVQADPKRPDDYSHVYVRVKVPGRGWVGADATMSQPFGWQVQGVPEKEWPASRDETEDHDPSVMGLGDFADEGAALATGQINIYGPAKFASFVPAKDLEPNDYKAGMVGLGDMSLDLTDVWGSIQNVFTPAWWSVPRVIKDNPQYLNVYSLIIDVYNGTIASKIRNYAAEIDAQERDVEHVENNIAAVPLADRPATVVKLSQARAGIKDSRTKLNSVVYYYNQVVNEVNRQLGTSIPTTGIAGLAVLPPITVGLVLAVSALAVALLGGLAAVIAAIRGNQTVVGELAGTVRSTGAAISAVGDTSWKIGLVALVGFGGFLLFKYLRTQKKWGV